MQGLTAVDQQHATTRDWPIIVTAGVGFFLSALDTGIMNVALPTLGQTFHVNVNTVAWTVTLYLISLSSTIIIFGRISDRVGRMKVYSIGLAVFAIASILCGSAFSAPQLIIFRGLQGIGAAMLQATSAAMITTYIAKERQGAALGTLGMILGLGNVLGPSAGGLLLSFVGWRWIFWINIPICAMGLWGCYKIARVTKEQVSPVPLNIVGSVLLGIATFSLLCGLSADSLPGFPRMLPYGFFALSLIGYIFWDTRVTNPIMPLSLFRSGAFIVPILSALVLGFATAIAFIVPAYYLEGVAHLMHWQVGLVNLAAPLGLVMLSKLSGKLIGSYGITPLTLSGLGIMFIALIALSTMQLNWHSVTFGALLLLYGFGAGIFIPANLSAIMGSVGLELQGTIGSVQRMVHNIGLAVGTSTAASMIRLDTNLGLSAFRKIWILSACAILIAFLGTALLHLFRRYRSGKI
ncbi:MFS transporter [Paenibacillus azoreducens]|uniref:MFS transporter n=1 Tax=Paenibacillus azoreducens TaxID=116718 RepID=UPI0039F54730